MENLATSSERRLRAAGKRITPQRRTVLDILARAETHLDAQEIYHQGRHRDAQISLATVYRTLTVLKETGVVHELHLDDNHHHYELADKAEHSHLVCLRCGKVFEVDSDAFAEAALQAGAAYDFEVTSTQVELTGYCASCSQE
ncbi:MAG: Fur family transcriptional regulator [Anaerolineae bacterium]|jgi:Fe2+ or Zn2+ uptake regulation protein